MKRTRSETGIDVSPGAEVEIPEELNLSTQPPDRRPVFNSWEVLPEAWYFSLRSNELKRGQAKPFRIGDQRLTLYRGRDGRVRALDGFCPHMGVDLALGKVEGDELRCYFHHWTFDGGGKCRAIPALKRRYDGEGLDVGLRSYPTKEKYGLIWIYAGREPRVDVLVPPDLEGKEIAFSLGRINVNRSHHHVSMINGIDPQHLRTVHGLSIEMETRARVSSRDPGEPPAQVEYVLAGETPRERFADRAMRFLFGPRYSYSMKYSQASAASLTLLRDVHFLSPRLRWPRLHMLYAYRPGRRGTSETQPIYVAEKGRGLLGALKARTLLWLTKRAYLFLKDGDDRVYDHVRFDSRRLLPIDKPVQDYVAFVDRLPLSDWSAAQSGAAPTARASSRAGDFACKDRSAGIGSTAEL